MSGMYFGTGKELVNFLFEGWNSKGQVTGLLGMCAAVLFATILLEAIRTLVTFLSIQHGRMSTVSSPEHNFHNCKHKYGEDEEDSKLRQRLSIHALLSVLQVFSTGLSYILMLAVMTYNVWIGIAVIAGAAIGYFFFGALRDHIIFTQKSSQPTSSWSAEKTPVVEGRKEILSQSNRAYKNSSSDLHM